MPAGRAHKEEKKQYYAYMPDEDAKKKQPQPEDLKKVGVQETGLAMTAAKSAKKYNEELQKVFEETK